METAEPDGTDFMGLISGRGVTQPISSCVCADRLGLSLDLMTKSPKHFHARCHLPSSGRVPVDRALQLPAAKPEQNVYFERCVFRKDGGLFFFFLFFLLFGNPAK